MSKAIYNFSAGPAALPKQVFEKSSNAILEFNGTGLSILEMSHRSNDIVEVMEESVVLVKELLDVPDSHKIIFLQGGASLQFCMVPYNLLNEGEKAGFYETGVWAKKAIKEAQGFGEAVILGSSADKVYSYLPPIENVPPDLKYLHLTSNNTIYGTQYKNFPDVPMPLVSDMSSDIFSRPLDVSKFGVIYAGAQKNMGPAGITLAIVHEKVLGSVTRHIPTILDYRTHISKNSMFNTPPVFALYVAKETLSWLKQQGGIRAIQKVNEAKAAKLYAEIDSNPLFTGPAAKEDRSVMNATFVLKDTSMQGEFLSFSQERGLSGLKGHRSIGGFRASIYNAMPEAGIDALVSAMREFAKLKG